MLFFLMIMPPPRSTRTYTLCPYTTLFLSFQVARSIICSVCKRVKNRSTALGDHPHAAASCERDTQSCPRSTVIVDPPTLNFVGFQHAFSTSHAHAPKRALSPTNK